MLHTVLSKINVIDGNYTQYLVQSYDETDLVNLVPNSEFSYLHEEELIQLYTTDSEHCANFSYNGTSLVLPEGLPKQTLPESSLGIPRIHHDDVWAFLHRLLHANALIVFSKAMFTKDGFTDDEASYLIPSKSLTYSTTHANCSASCLINGSIIDEFETVSFSRRWSTMSIIKNNEIKTRHLVIITTAEELEKLVNESAISYKYVVINKLTLNNAKELDELSDDNELYYVIFDLASIPLVTTSRVLLSNYAYLTQVVEQFNADSMSAKAIDAFVRELIERHPDLQYYIDGDDTYRKKFLNKEKSDPTVGVQFAISGQVSQPSVNASLKALKLDNVRTVVDVFDASPTKLKEIQDSMYKLNKLQYTCVDTLLHLVNEYHTVANPSVCQRSADALLKVYNQQREVKKSRLNYIRSMFITNFTEEMFNHGKTFSNKLGDSTLIISLGKY